MAVPWKSDFMWVFRSTFRFSQRSLQAEYWFLLSCSCFCAFFLVSTSLIFQRLDWIVLRLSWTALSLSWIFMNFFQLASKTNSLPLRCFCEASCWLHGLCAMGVLRPCCLQHFIKIYTSNQQQHTSCVDFLSSMSRPSHFPKHDACAAFLTALTLCCGLITELPFLGVIRLVIRSLQKSRCASYLLQPLRAPYPAFVLLMCKVEKLNQYIEISWHAGSAKSQIPK